MLYLFTALYCEAHILIRKFGLSGNPENTWPQEFYNEEAGIRLTVTGAGEVSAAVAVGSVCSVYRPAREDVLVNVGICAQTEAEGEDGIFLCSKITEQATGRTFYPDMLYRHGFREAAIVTGMVPWNGGGNGETLQKDEEMPPRNGKRDKAEQQPAVPAGSLYDMEAAAIYQAGSRFFGPHQMIFLKIVSDRGAAVSAEQTERLMEKYQEPVSGYIRQMQEIMYENGGGERYLRQNEEELLEKLCRDMHCSKAMRDSMRQYIRYLTLAGADYISVIRHMYEKGLLPCKDKKEGKLRFEELKRRVF